MEHVAQYTYVFGSHIFFCLAIVFQARLISPESGDYVTTINSSQFTNNTFPEMSLGLPLEIIQRVSNKSLREDGRVRAVSFLYYNVENLFPSGRPGETE